MMRVVPPPQLPMLNPMAAAAVQRLTPQQQQQLRAYARAAPTVAAAQLPAAAYAPRVYGASTYTPANQPIDVSLS